MSGTTITRYLTADEVSTECFGGAVSSSKVLLMRAHDGLPAHRIGRRYMFRADEVDAWVRARSETHTAPTEPDAGAADSEWVAAQLAKFTPDDFRRAGELLLALSRSAA
jgi:excisionase family DNA binding protein